MDHARRGSRLAVPILAALVCLALAPAAWATFPGANGLIAFTSERNGNPEIYTMTPAAESPTRLTELASDDRSPAWSQAGADIAFTSNRGMEALGDFEIYRMGADGTDPLEITNNSIDDSAPAWAPGDGQLVIVQHEVADTELFILDANGSGATTPLTGPISTISGPVDPDWSASNRIAFAAIPSGGSQHDIYTINPNRTGLTNVTNTPTRDEREPSWSPDSTQIAYAGVDGSNYRIHRIGANGTGDFAVTSNATENIDDRDPAWSPAGDFIAYVSRSFESSPTDDIFRIPATGGPRFQMTFHAGPDISPSWQRATPQCSDGVDNDGDDLTDFPADPGCTSAADNNESSVACSDGVDNDGDGKTDYPNDPGCTSASDNDEFNQIAACGDGVDNDGDNLTDYPADPGCTSVTDADEFNAAAGGAFVRPKHAALLNLPLVPAFDTCVSPNRQHGPPLAFPSCNPPVPSSTSVTVGEPSVNGADANSIGRIKITSVIGAPGPPDTADVNTTLAVTDVRCKNATTACGMANAVDGPDYTGQLQANATIRITDRFNATSAGGGADAATMVDIPFPVPADCANTVDTASGATCMSNTSLNAIVPAAIRERKRTNIEVAQIFLNDGGPDGVVNTVPNTNFMKQGLFVP